MHGTKQRTVPLWAILAARRKNLYGGIPDLPDDELADPEELERQVHLEEFAPVLRLRTRGQRREFRPVVGENGELDWGAFGTVDFDRMSPHSDNRRYRLELLRDELENVLIMLGIVNRRLPGTAKYLVLKYLRMGIIDTEHVENTDVLTLARLQVRVKRLQAEIALLDEEGRPMSRKQEAWLLS